MTLSACRLRELLNYNHETGVFTRLVTVTNGRGGHIGAVAGTLMWNGYRHIQIDGRQYLAHRLAWLYMTGGWPRKLDHLNRDKADNRFENLREATRAQNRWNSTIGKNNKTGATGVSRDNRRGCWQVRIDANGKWRFTRCYGSFKEAAALRRQWEKELHGEFRPRLA